MYENDKFDFMTKITNITRQFFLVINNFMGKYKGLVADFCLKISYNVVEYQFSKNHCRGCNTDIPFRGPYICLLNFVKNKNSQKCFFFKVHLGYLGYKL